MSLFTAGRAGAGFKPFWEDRAKGSQSGQPLFASRYGFPLIIATSSAKHPDYLKSIGATHVVDRDTHVDKVKDILQGQPLKYIHAVVDAI
ncbi:hypothetical protein PQX77_007597 [Marasmius sp. AFHP31]|nr:hypothetical protein PQX77_007597 [Marasmius sp. AFHP31]